MTKNVDMSVNYWELIQFTGVAAIVAFIIIYALNKKVDKYLK